MGPCSNTRQAQGENQKTTISRELADSRWAGSRSRSAREDATRSVGLATLPVADAIIVFERLCYSRQALSQHGALEPYGRCISPQQAPHFENSSRQWGYRLDAGSGDAS
jgi:hypothetical protein